MQNQLIVTMPDIGEGVVEGEVIEWLKPINDFVKQDEPVVVVMTDKATVELPAPRPGKLIKQYYAPGQIAIKDQPLYALEVEGDIPAQHSIAVKESAPCPLSKPQQPTKTGKGLTIPPIRRMAKELKIDLSTIQGTGKGGRITVDDLQAHLSKRPPQQQPIVTEKDDTVKPLIGVRRLMSEKMKASKDHIPHFSYFEKVDVTHLVELRENIKQQALKESIHITYMPFFIRALSLCIQQFPEINSSLDETTNQLVIHAHHNIGVAVAGSQGLVVAVLRDVQNQTFDQLVRSYEDLKARAAAGKLEPHEMKGSTITISNFGGLGGNGLWATPIINYPESAILAVDRIRKQPVVKNNQVVIRDVLNVSWSFDHRFIDGEAAAAISSTYCALVCNPAPLL